MKINAIKGDYLSLSADILAIFTFSQASKSPIIWQKIDELMEGVLGREVKEMGYSGGENEVLMLSTHGKLPAKRIALIGLGQVPNFNSETLRRAAASFIKTVKNKNLGAIVFAFDLTKFRSLNTLEAATAFGEGAMLTAYEFSKYKEKKNKKPEKELQISLILKDVYEVKQAQKGIKSAQIGSAATCYARDLVNEPASICVPKHLAEHAREIGKASKGKVSVKIFDKEECKKRQMGAFLSVAAGAGEEPYFIHLIYKPKGAKKKIALVGKGITFDSGGLQIKPGESMSTMKLDMAGAAAVLGVFSRITEFAPKAEVHGIIAATENMPGPRAYKPGDIVRASNGKTIEIGHTDAEGRVTLADSLSYAAKLKPYAILDLATLTGACMVALGEEVAGIMSNSQKFVEDIKKSAQISGEKIWELPLISEYKGLIKGHHGDVRNSGGSRYGGAITAGLFLQEFVSGVPWAHLDIAGPAWAERETNPYMPLGGTGFGVRTLINFLKKI